MKPAVAPVAIALLLAVLGTASPGRATPAAAPMLPPKTAGSTTAPPTFNRDIAPLIYGTCSSCHHAGGVGPFALMSYSDVTRHARQIVAMTAARLMPPWLPEPGYGDFRGSRRLSGAEIDLIRGWVATGMPEGRAEKLPRPPKFPDGWQLGKPDLVVTMPRPYLLSAGGENAGDVFRNFVLPVPLAAPRYVRAIELHPGASKVFHHANLLVDRSGWARRRDARDGSPGFAGMELYIQSDRFDPDSQFLFWKPGSPADPGDPEMSWEMEPGTDLVLNLHMRPSGKPETIQASAGIYFSDRKPTKLPLLLQLENDRALDIPAGDRAFLVRDDFTLPMDVEVLAVYPHAHYLGKDVKAFARLPNGQKKWLIWIKDWNFDWQAVFPYRQPVYLPRGSTVHMQWRYDNSAANPRNPHQPPHRVTAGNQATDEMAHLWLQVLPVHWSNPHEDPRLVLQAAMMLHRAATDPDDYFARFNLAADLQLLGRPQQSIAEYHRAIALRPDDAVAHNGLASVLETAGDRDGSLAEYRRAVELDRDNADANYNLGRAYATLGKYAEAAACFRSVLRSKPDDAAAYNALGDALLSAGNHSQAIEAFAQAIRLDPKLADAHYNLGLVLAGENDLAGAEQHLSEAARLNPSSADAHMRFGDVLARQNKLNEAMSELKTALALTPDYADARTDLAIIYAKRGDLVRAEAELRRALETDPGNVAARQNLEVILRAKRK